MSESESETQVDDDKLCILERIKEVYQKAVEAEKETPKEDLQTVIEFTKALSHAVGDRSKIDPNVAYDTLVEEITDLFNNEDQYSTFIAACEYMMETNLTMRQIIRFILNVLNYIKHTPAYKLCKEIQSLPIHRDDKDMDFERSFYDDICKSDPKKQHRNKKKSKKRKMKKNLVEDEAAAGGNDAATTDEIEDYIPKLEEMLHGMDFSEIVITENLSPDLPKITPDDDDMPAKAQKLVEIITSEIFDIAAVISDTCLDQQIAFLNRELLNLQKKTAVNTEFFEKRETDMKATIKEILAKTEMESREQQKLENQIQTLEAEIEKVEQMKEDIVKKIEKVDDSTFVKYKTQWQNTIKRFHDLEEEVKNVSFTIRREKQSFSDLSNAAKKEDEALKKEIEALEAAVQRKQTQLGACEAKLESENQRYEDEQRKLLSSIKTSEMLLLRSTHDKEKLNLVRKKNVYSSENYMNDTCPDVSSRQNSNESVKEVGGARTPFRTDQRISGNHLIGVIPPYYNENVGNRWPIGVVPPNYVIHNDRVYIPPPVNQQQQQPVHQNVYSSENYMNDNTYTYPDVSSRQNSNESLKEVGGGARTPFRTDQRISGNHLIGVIPPYYNENVGNRWPIGVVPPNYVIHNDRVWIPPPVNQQQQQQPVHQNVYLSENYMNDNTDTYPEVSSRQNSNESLKEVGGGVRTPFRTDQRISGKYPIGVIPPYYKENVTKNGRCWTPPENLENVFKFPPLV